MMFRGKGGGISRRRRRLNGGDCRNRLPILQMPISGDHKDIEEPLTAPPPPPSAVNYNWCLSNVYHLLFIAQRFC